jgi:hypothetical protein
MDVAILSVVEIKTAPTGEACGHNKCPPAIYEGIRLCRRNLLLDFWIFRYEIHIVGLYKKRYLQKAYLFESLTQKTRRRIFVVVAKKNKNAPTI